MHLCRGVHVRMTFGSLAAVPLALLAASCGGNTTTITEITGPDVVRCATTVSLQQQSFPSDGSRATVNVVAARECSWTAQTDASWAQVSPSSGQGEASVTVTVSANPDARTRSGSVAINEARLSLSQEPAPCRFQLGSGEVRMSQQGGQTAVGVTTNGSCDWRASSETSWVRVLTVSGSGDGRVELDVNENSGSERSAVVRIADQTVRIVQSGRAPAPPSPGPTPTPPNPGPSDPPNPPPPPPPRDERVSFSGRAFFVDGSCPSLSFFVDFRRVVTNGDTKFSGGNCRDIRSGASVSGEGRVSDGRVVATEINVRDRD